MSDLTTNNASLQAILNQINTLPEAGGGSGDDIVETGILYGSSSRLAAPTETIYYNLEEIPNLSSKLRITLLQNYVHLIVLSRTSVNADFVILYNYKPATMETCDITISENVMTIVSDYVPNTLYYLAI